MKTTKELALELNTKPATLLKLRREYEDCIEVEKDRNKYLFPQESQDKLTYIHKLTLEGHDHSSIREGLNLWNTTTIIDTKTSEPKPIKMLPSHDRSELLKVTLYVCLALTLNSLILREPILQYILLKQKQENCIIIYNEDTAEFLNYFKKFKEWKKKRFNNNG